ncbi:MAG: type II secretion system protein GspN [Pseudomonadota bacterium]|nr:type II secretion system protein GspN [Pseudomonadota bacterium]
MQKILSALIQSVIGVFKNHKKKILALMTATLFFSLFLFPFGDLGDLVNSKISEQTQGAVSLHFEDMGIDIIPRPGLQFSKVSVTVNPLPEISLRSLTIAPSILALLSSKLGASISAGGLFGGDLSMSFKDQSKDKKMLYDISAGWEDIRIDQILKLAKLTSFANGVFDGEFDGSFDPSFSEQPKGSLVVGSKKLELTQLPVPVEGEMYYQPLSKAIRFKKIDLNLQLADKTLVIEKSSLLASDDDLDCKVDGKVDLTLAMYNGNLTPQFGNFSVNLDLKISQYLSGALPLLDILLSACKAGGEGGTLRYRCRIAGRAGSNPQITKIQ